MIKEIEELIDVISNAASKVDDKFLNLQTTYNSTGIVRERVFCYELYHQMRIILGDKHPLSLNGEIDKRGHFDFKKQDRKNPDFIFHIPGQHECNTIILEVKGVISNDIIKDFKTIILFLNKYNYKAGVFLLYNHTLAELKKAFKEMSTEDINSEFDNNICIITLPKAHKIEKFQMLSSLNKS